MNPHILVCPDSLPFLSGFHGQELVVRTQNPERIPDLVKLVESQNILRTVWLDIKTPLSEVHWDDAWTDIPLAIHSPEMGNFRIIAGTIPLIRKLNLRVFLPDDGGNNYRSLRILASLGIHCGLTFTDRSPAWEPLADLAHYALYGLVRKATIEPFHYIASQHNPEARTNFGSVVFDDPTRFLHLTVEGKVALSRQDLLEENFILETLEGVGDITELEGYQDRKESWREFFLQDDGCAYCPAWRVCLGRFDAITEDRKACAALFLELMDAADHYRQKQGKEREVWQL